MRLSGSALLVLSLLMVNEALAAKKGGVKPTAERKSSKEKIAGGIGDFRYVSSVSIQYYDQGRRYHHCGGTLIKVDWVLTAAHCLYLDFPYVIYAGSFDAYEAANGSNTGQQIRYVRWMTVHKDYNMETLENDIGLINLELPVVRNRYVGTTMLADLQRVLPSECVVSGWGNKTVQRGMKAGPPGEGVAMPTDAKNKTRKQTSMLWEERLYVPIIEFEQCKGQMHSVLPNLSLKRDSTVCAGGVNGQGACHGDDGAALMCGPMAGIMSYGYGCGRQGFPSVYTRVAYFKEWIEHMISKGRYRVSLS